MELKITTLIENQPGQDGRLAFEHGLSLFIEFAGKRLLFDTGQTGAFADNAEKLSIDLSQLDAVILSHGHYDHSGGLARLLPLDVYKRQLPCSRYFPCTATRLTVIIMMERVFTSISPSRTCQPQKISFKMCIRDRFHALFRQALL